MNLAMARIAWRNLWRHKQRTILMVVTVAVGSLAIVTLFGFMGGFVASMTSSQIDWDQGDFQVRTTAYGDDPAPNHALSQEEIFLVTRRFADLPIAGIALRIEAPGMLRSGYAADGITLRGVEPAKEAQVTHLRDLVVEGQYLSTSGDMLLPMGLAQELDVRVGERVVALFEGKGGTTSRAFTVSGLVESPSLAMDQVGLVPIGDMQAGLGIEGATALAVSLADGVSAVRTVGKAREALAGLPSVEVADYFDLNPFARYMITGSTIQMIPFVIMISLMAGFGVANTAFYSFLERTREFGVMTAVGTNHRRLARIVLMESSIVASIGFVVGGGAAYGLLKHLGRDGWDLSMFTDIVGSIGIPRVVYATTSGWYWVAALGVVVCTALAAAWYPARRVSRLEPVTAIREG